MSTVGESDEVAVSPSSAATAEWFRSLREVLNLKTRQEVAKALGIGSSTARTYANGKSRVPLTVILAASALAAGVTPIATVVRDDETTGPKRSGTE